MRLKHWIVTGLGLVVGSGSAWASGFYTAEFYAAQIGQALAATTMTENAGVVANNPSAMVRLDEGMHVLGGLTLFDIQTDYQAFDAAGNVEESGSSITEVTSGPGAYGVWNRGKNAVGVGLYFPFASRAEYAPDWVGRDVLVSQEITVGYTVFAGAWEISPEFSFGFGVNFIGATAELKQNFVTGNAGVEIPVTLAGSGDAIGSSLSFLYEGDNWAIGFNHNPKYNLKIEGTVNFDTSAAPGLASTFADGPASVSIGLPAISEIGISWKQSRRNPLYFIELNVLHTGWSNFKEIRIDFINNLPQDESVRERNWVDTLDYKLGGNWVISRNGDTDHIIRGGILVGEAPGNPDTLDPAVPDGEGRFDYALGYGYKSGGLRLDTAYLFADIKKSTAGGTNEFPATYKTDAQVLSFSVAYQF